MDLYRAAAAAAGLPPEPAPEALEGFGGAAPFRLADAARRAASAPMSRVPAA
jgi:hypothetical protein